MFDSLSKYMLVFDIFTEFQVDMPLKDGICTGDEVSNGPPQYHTVPSVLIAATERFMPIPEKVKSFSNNETSLQVVSDPTCIGLDLY